MQLYGEDEQLLARNVATYVRAGLDAGATLEWFLVNDVPAPERSFRTQSDGPAQPPAGLLFALSVLPDGGPPSPTSRT